MKSKRYFGLIVVLLILIAAVAVWARAYVIGASSFNSNGASIAGWR